MVQDFTTSFDQFETFAVSEMAKQPENNDPLSPFTPKFWANRDPSNALTSYSDTSITDQSNLHNYSFLTPRRSNRIANQTKVDYNENIPKKGEHSKKSRKGNHKRIKAIKRLFKKPSDIENPKKKPKSERVKRARGAKKARKMPNKLCISIPLTKTTLLTTSVTKGSLKIFKNILTMKPDEHSDFTMMEEMDEKFNKVEMETVIDNTEICQINNNIDIFDGSKKNIQSEQKSVFEDREGFSTLKTIEASNKIKVPTENKLGNIFGNRFSGAFKSFKEIVFVDSSKENEKLDHDIIANSADTKFCQSNDNDCDNSPNVCEKLEQNIVSVEERKQPPDELMEVSDETEDPINIEVTKQNSEEHQIMEISYESHQNLKKKFPKDPENFSKENAVFKETHQPERSIIKEALGEKEQPLDLTIMDTSDETWRSRKNDVKNEKNDKVFDDLTQMDVSEEIPTLEKNISNDVVISGPDYSVTISDLLKKNKQPDQNVKAECRKEKHKIPTLSLSKLKNVKQTSTVAKIFKDCTVLSDNLSVMKISDKVQNGQTSKDQESSNLKIPEVLQNPTAVEVRNDTPEFKKTFSDVNTETSYDDDDDICIVENNPLKQINITGVSKKYQSQSSNSTISNENEKDHEADYERDSTNEDIIIEELKSLIGECPLEGSEKSYEVNSMDVSNNFENPPETVVIEVEINEGSNDSEIEVTEESFSNNENTNEEDVNKNSDDVEMLFPQANHGVYQQEFIEIHQYNYFQFQNYQYPRYELNPIIEENKFDHIRSNSRPILSQRYGEFQIPQMFWDYNNCRMQFHSQDNFEQENKLQITEYYDSEEEDKEKELNINQNIRENKNPNKKQLTLSQPPPIQCTSEQSTTQFSLQSQNQFGQICENSLYLQGHFSQNNSASTNNQWQIVSAQNSVHTSSEQTDSQLYENTICSVQVSPHYLNKDIQSEQSGIVQRLDQVATQNFHHQNTQTQIIERQHQGISVNNLDQRHQPLSKIADFVKNNCQIHDVKFGKIKILNGRMYRTGSVLITFGDHYQVQIIGDLIFNNINENIAFDAFFKPRTKF